MEECCECFKRPMVLTNHYHDCKEKFSNKLGKIVRRLGIFLQSNKELLIISMLLFLLQVSASLDWDKDRHAKRDQDKECRDDWIYNVIRVSVVHESCKSQNPHVKVSNQKDSVPNSVEQKPSNVLMELRESLLEDFDVIPWKNNHPNYEDEE